MEQKMFYLGSLVEDWRGFRGVHCILDDFQQALRIKRCSYSMWPMQQVEEMWMGGCCRFAGKTPNTTKTIASMDFPMQHIMT
jgi:hypothetical protein